MVGRKEEEEGEQGKKSGKILLGSSAEGVMIEEVPESRIAVQRPGTPIDVLLSNISVSLTCLDK